MDSQIPDQETLKLAIEDVRRVVDKQKEERQILITQINILFVTNTAFLTILTVSKLILNFSLFSLGEIFLLLLNFSILLKALLPRQFAVTPNPENNNFLQSYLQLTPKDYLLQMLVNLVAAYNANRQPLSDIAQSVTYTAFITLILALIVLSHLFTFYFIPQLQQL
jgi:hypothetical protein